MKQLLIYLLFPAILLANNSYPELFSQLGTPLYKANIAFARLPYNQHYSSDIALYDKHQGEALALNRQGNEPAYFKALRALSKEHDMIISMLKRELSKAMEKKDNEYFFSLSNAGIDDVYTQESFKILNYEYYIENKKYGRCDYLEKRIASEKGYEKRYGRDISSHSYVQKKGLSSHPRQKEVIILSRPGCGYCVKAKAFMEAQGVRFSEYNILTSSRGKSLFKKHQGSGVPLIIIGDEVIRGYSESSILNAL